ncbi:MAG: phage holin family protein [Bacilli bacterium]|nr:phage holin family protein [Bacilli bacterium]
MKLIVIDKKENKVRINRFIEWLIHTVGYALILICMSVIFPKTFYINNDYFGLYGLIASILISILNQTIKPMIVLFTLPITGITLGIFYPFINVFILYLVSFVLGNNFVIHGIFFPFLIAILISIMNILMDGLIIKPILERNKK